MDNVAKPKRVARVRAPIDYRIVRGLEEYVHSTLFNEVFLFRDLPLRHPEVWDSEFEGQFDVFFTHFQSLAKSGRPEDLEKSNSSTVENWIMPVLESLGWVSEPVRERSNLILNTLFSVIDRQGNEVSMRPSILVCPDQRARDTVLEYRRTDRALTELRNSEVLPISTGYFNSIADRHSGRYNTDADEIGSRGDTYTALGLDHQTFKYLGLTGTSWGMATDGAKWRLYCRDTVANGSVPFYEFDLGRLYNELRTSTSDDHLPLREIAKYFYWFFSRESLTKKPVPFVSRVREDSKVYTDKVEEDLKERFVHAMTIACNSYRASYSKSKGGNVDLDLVQGVAESFIFTLLFIRSCESGRVLPLHQDYIPVSLHNLVNKIRDYRPQDPWKKNKEALALRMSVLCPEGFQEDGTEMYEYVCNLYDLVHKGSGNSKKFGFVIHGFKEGLFDPKELPFYEKNKLDNKSMVQLLFELFYYQSERDDRTHFQVAFSSFSPRQLGSIYESFLEFTLDRTDEALYYVKRKTPKKTLWQWVSKSELPKGVKSENLYSVSKGDLVFSPNNRERKATGSYYTPDHVVNYIVKSLLDPYLAEFSAKDILKIKLCDPAMGSGHFLSGALTYLAEVYITKSATLTVTDLKEVKRKLLGSCIFGVDINTSAVKLAKMSLWLESASAGEALEGLDDQLKCGDSLVDSLDKYRFNFDWKKNFPGVTFDFLLGNPPWITFMGKEKVSDVYDNQYTSYLQTNFGNSNGYKLNSFATFIERATALLAHGKVLGFVVPATILENQYNADIRKHLLQQYDLVEVAKLPNDTFDGVCAESIVLVCKKNTKQKAIRIYDHLDSKNPLVHSFESILNTPDCVINHRIGERAAGKISEILKDNISVDDLFQVYVGVVTGDNKKFLSDRKEDKRWKKIITGSGMRKYAHEWKGKYILWDPEKLHSNTKMEAYDVPVKILVRKTGDKLIASLDTDRAFTEQTIYNLIPKAKMDLETAIIYTVILNSSVLEDIFRKVFITNEKAYPYIKGIHLKQLPLVQVEELGDKLKKEVIKFYTDAQENAELRCVTMDTYLAKKFGIAKD